MHRKLRGGIALFMALLALFSLCVPGALAEATLSSSKTPLGSSSNAKVTNISLAVSAINGTTVEVGGYFSFNDAVGPRTSSYGYKNALNGRGVKVTGGGVAQVASTLYLALKKLDGITYDERQTYPSFSDSYVSNKKNAIMVDYKAGIDFSFYNDTASALRIDVWITDDNVHCSLVSEDEGPSSSASTSGIGYCSLGITGGSAVKANVMLAADSIYDTALSNGDTFSFNDIVGPRTERYGYVNAVNGRGVQVIGGGVAQVASAIYKAVKDMDCVEMLEKTTYNNFNQSYVQNAGDAIAVDYASDIDFSFRYTGYGTLNLYTYVSDDTLYCEASEF